MGGFGSYNEIKRKREEIRRQREFLGEEIQRSFLSLGDKPEAPWYKSVDNWFLVGDVAYEVYKRFKN